MLAVMGTALAPNFAAQVVLRFFAGFFASPSMAIFGGSLADMFDKEELGFVWSLFATSPIIGRSSILSKAFRILLTICELKDIFLPLLLPDGLCNLL